MTKAYFGVGHRVGRMHADAGYHAFVSINNSRILSRLIDVTNTASTLPRKSMNAPRQSITLAADLPLNRFFPVQALLDAFAELATRREDVKLLLTGKRCADSS